MQTFLPYASFKQSASCLDYRRLGKQRVEAYQILRTLSGQSSGWKHHPCTRMWSGYESLLAEYGFFICTEWRSRGYNDSLLLYFNTLNTKERLQERVPEWLGDERLHSSYRAALLFKDENHYSQFDWDEEPRLNYYWPV